MMPLHVLEVFKSLTDKDFRILSGIERLMATQSFPRVLELPRQTGLSETYIQKKLQRLHALDLIRTRRNDEEYYEVTLKYKGYDALALQHLVQTDILASVGPPIGVGKESEVYNVILEGGETCALKVHRLGKMNFRATKRHRDYIAEKRHSSRFYESKIAAEREAKALTTLHGLIPVPRLIAQNRHMLVMERINGGELQKFRHLDLSQYEELYEKIMSYVRTAAENNFIHGDLSAYNILLETAGDQLRPYIIDWPQYLPANHENALNKLMIDVGNLYSFFGKRISVDIDDVEEVATNILAKVDQTSG